ncbi:hypothetical protein B7463_g11836, partial [Scytalidium lignicola]
MSSTQEQIDPCRKRERIETESFDCSSESQPSKRHKSHIKLHSAEFYDSLPKVWLTRRALKELDRRISQASNPQQPTSVPQLIPGEDTWKQIRRFAGHGGPELCDLRRCPAPPNVTQAMSFSCSTQDNKRTQSTAPMTTPPKTGRSSAYDDNFEQHLIDYHIYPEGYDYPNSRKTPEPTVLRELHEILAQPRPSLSPSCFTTLDFQDFKQKNARAISERKVMSTVLPKIYGNTDIPNEGDLVFTRLDPIANNTTVDVKPDFYDGAHFEDVDQKCPTFFLETKAPSGGADVAKRQACYDGAFGARAMHNLQSYGKGGPVYDGNAYTITSTYHAGTGTLQMYTTHLTQGKDADSSEYHMTQVKAWALTSDPDTFRQGAMAFRNARDWARGHRDKFIAAANEKSRSISAKPLDYNDVLNAAYVQDNIYLEEEDSKDKSRDLRTLSTSRVSRESASTG